jgi:hypothetical protein
MNSTKISYLNINSPKKAKGNIKNISLNFLFIKISTRTKIIKISLIKYVGGLIGGLFNENIPSITSPESKLSLLR